MSIGYIKNTKLKQKTLWLLTRRYHQWKIKCPSCAGVSLSPRLPYNCNNHFIFLSLGYRKKTCSLIKKMPKTTWYISMIWIIFEKGLVSRWLQTNSSSELLKSQLEFDIKKLNIIRGNKRKLSFNFSMLYSLILLSLKRNQLTAIQKSNSDRILKDFLSD